MNKQHLFDMCYTGYKDIRGKTLFAGDFVLIEGEFLNEDIEQVGRVYLHFRLGFIVVFEAVEHHYVFSLEEIHQHLEKLIEST